MLSKIAVMPHGDEVLIPEDNDTQKLHLLMREIGEDIKDVDEYIIITPHNIRIDDHIGVILTEYAYGFWRYRNIRFGRKYRCDRELAHRIYERCKLSNISCVGINFGALEGKLSKISLDWGTLIPLYFLPKKPIVMLTPARKISRELLIHFGELLAEILEGHPREVALIISADNAHAHRENGPYGYAPEAKKYDEIVVEAFKNSDLSPLLTMEDSFIERAKPDSYWQFLILYGALKKFPRKVKKYAYALPTYFGMLAAMFE